MAKMNDVRITQAEIARDARLSPEYVEAIMAHYEPLGTNEAGEPLYSIVQMCAAILRGTQM
ncbi:hypothetical protein ABKU91_20235 (plasmid) [Enterobacter hormaechei]|uniref:hypothetical protein n=1 Tax=unclassified Enterobacter cloacae complex TaxID=2757714 RepID=UPI0032B0B7DD|nr:hypothetical protein [Enterobacter hormaechei]